MTTTSAQIAIKRMTEKHTRLFDAPLGERKCKYELIPECLGTADESMFKGRMCKKCVSRKLKILYDIRVAKRGYPRQKPGPKVAPIVASDSEDEEPEVKPTKPRTRKVR